MGRFSLPISQLLYESYVVFYNGRHETAILRELETFGIDSVWLDEALALHARAERLDEIQRREYTEQYAATDAVNELWERASKLYRFHRKAAQRTFTRAEDRDIFMGLLLNERYPVLLGDWIRQARRFYAFLLGQPTAMGQLERRWKIKQPNLIDAQDKVERVRALDVAQEQEKSEAQEATQQRDKVLLALNERVDDLKMIAELALEGKQDLESLLVRPV